LFVYQEFSRKYRCDWIQCIDDRGIRDFSKSQAHKKEVVITDDAE